MVTTLLTGPHRAPFSGQSPKGLVIALHGYGSNGDDLISLAPYWEKLLPDVQFSSPNAPARVPGFGEMYQWFPIESMDPVHLAKGPKIFPNHALAALTFYITTMGLIYHLLLSGGRNLSGMNLVGDVGVHYAVPALTLVWWFLFANKDGVKFGHAFLWLAWPLLYTSAALLRGRFEDWYPYFFLDAGKYGLGQIGLNVLGLGFGFLVMGFLFVILAKGLKRFEARPF